MNWITIVGVIYIACHVIAHIYGWRHQDDPFWKGFCNPFGIRR